MHRWWWNWLELRNVCPPPVRTEPAEVPDTTLRQACMVRLMNLNELLVGPVGLWAKGQAVGNAQRCPRVEPVRRRRMVHKSTGLAPRLRYRVRLLNSFSAGKVLGCRDIDWHRLTVP